MERKLQRDLRTVYICVDLNASRLAARPAVLADCLYTWDGIEIVVILTNAHATSRRPADAFECEHYILHGNEPIVQRFQKKMAFNV